MALSRLHTWISGEVLTASDLNAEFNNIIDNLSFALSGDIIDGTIASPGLRFVSDTDTGLHRPGVDQFELVAGGATAFRLTRLATGTAFAQFARRAAISERFYPALTWGGPDDGINAVSAGTIDLVAGGRRVLQASSYAQATNYVRISPAQSGQSPIVDVAGADANIGLKLQGKGTGYVNLIAGTATDFARLINPAGRTWKVRGEVSPNFQSSHSLVLDNDNFAGLQLHLVDKSGGQRVWIWDSGTAGPALQPHTGAYPAFAVQGDITVGDILTFSPSGNSFIMGGRTATGLVAATDITQIFSSAQQAGVDVDGGANINLYPAQSGAVSDGIVELMAYGKGSGALANHIIFSNRGGVNTVTRRWKINGSGHFLPAATGSYTVGSLTEAPLSIAAHAGTGIGTGHVGVILNLDTAAGTGSPADTNENDLKTYTLPSNSLATDGDLLRITMSFRCDAGVQTKRIRIYFGGTVLLDSSAIANTSQIYNVQLCITRTGASAQYCQGAVIGTATHNVWSTTLNGDCNFPADPGKNLASAQIIKATVQQGAVAALNAVIQDMMIVEYLRKA